MVCLLFIRSVRVRFPLPVNLLSVYKLGSEEVSAHKQFGRKYTRQQTLKCSLKDTKPSDPVLPRKPKSALSVKLEDKWMSGDQSRERATSLYSKLFLSPVQI
ncbi:hypothetical protein ILYODFUR_016396 [Ilyodon furcidens]|uniref:Uncharacterized protein n=1 Tax=Ilyodon furcidens TaxID=33524 RepID=A0ABV0UTU1_9TELE